jgi:hypothetical protein
VLRKLLHLKPYKLSMLQAITDAVKQQCKEFCVDILQQIEDGGRVTGVCNF